MGQSIALLCIGIATRRQYLATLQSRRTYIKDRTLAESKGYRYHVAPLSAHPLERQVWASAHYHDVHVRLVRIHVHAQVGHILFGQMAISLVGTLQRHGSLVQL